MKSLSIASLCAAIAVFIVTFLFSAIESVGSAYLVTWISLLIASVAALVALVAVVVWALPLHFVLKKLNRQNLVWYVFGSIVPSVTFIYAFKPFGEDSNIDLMKQAFFCSVCGVIAAAVFWYQAVYRLRIVRHESSNAS